MAIQRSMPARGSVLKRLEERTNQRAKDPAEICAPPAEAPQPQTEEAAELPERAQPAAGAVAVTGRPNVLVGDTGEAVAALLAEALDSDYDVNRVADGDSLCRAAFTDRPDLILLSLSLTGETAIGLCRELKSDSRTRDIPVIVLGSDQGDEDGIEISALECGAIDFLRGPLRPSALALRVSNHLLTKRSRDNLVSQSLIDPTTGIANRRQFEFTFEKEWRRAARLGVHLSLILVDIAAADDQPLSDEDLRKAAHVLYGTLQRPADSLARYGGNRFAFILPQTDAPGAALLGNRARTQLGQWRPRNSDTVVKLHMGIATTEPTREVEEVTLLRQAVAAITEWPRT